MIFAKDLILKGVAGLAVVGGLGAGGIYVWNQRKGKSLQFLTEKVGLSCTGTPEGTNGVECQIKTGSVLAAKQNDNKDTGLSRDSASTNGKIKVYRDETEGEQGYEHGFKFTIEEANITLSGGSVSEEGKKVKTLEEFETYEIREDDTDKKLYLTRKTEAKDGIKKALGLEDCDFPTSGQDGCDIAGDKFKKVKFDGISVSDANGPTGTKLKISAESNKTDFPLGYKFVLELTNDAKISNDLTVKASINTEFKIKVASATGTGGPRTLTLEKAWTAKSLGAKVGLECPESADATKECTLKETGINVHNGSTNKYSNLSRGAGNDTKKVKFDEDVVGHNQGFKFYTEETNGITLQNGTGASGGDEANRKIEYKGNGGGTSEVTYEIKKDTDGTWYLTKKTAAGAGA